jgi:hypothetical protein
MLLAACVRELKVDVRLSQRPHVNAHTSAYRKVRQIMVLSPVSDTFNFYAHLP